MKHRPAMKRPSKLKCVASYNAVLMLRFVYTYSTTLKLSTSAAIAISTSAGKRENSVKIQSNALICHPNWTNNATRIAPSRCAIVSADRPRACGRLQAETRERAGGGWRGGRPGGRGERTEPLHARHEDGHAREKEDELRSERSAFRASGRVGRGTGAARGCAGRGAR